MSSDDSPNEDINANSWEIIFIVLIIVLLFLTFSGAIMHVRRRKLVELKGKALESQSQLDP